MSTRRPSVPAVTRPSGTDRPLVAVEDSSPLTAIERANLARHEEVIGRDLKAFLRAGSALHAVQAGRLYRETHPTIEAYMRDRWGLSRTVGYDLIGASVVTLELAAAGAPVPVNEGQAREIRKVEPERRAEVMAKAVAQTGGKPTAKAIRQAAAPEPEVQSVTSLPARKGNSAPVQNLTPQRTPQEGFAAHLATMPDRRNTDRAAGLWLRGAKDAGASPRELVSLLDVWFAALDALAAKAVAS